MRIVCSRLLVSAIVFAALIAVGATVPVGPARSGGIAHAARSAHP
jgi:hypothetical protein